MSQYGINILKSQNGIDRDNTVYSSDYYIQAQWARFYEDHIRKIGGYTITVPGDYAVGDAKPVIRSMFVIPGDNLITLYIGRYNKVTKITIFRDGTTSGGEVNVTPAATGWDPANVNNIWQFEQFTNVVAGVKHSNIFALVLPNSLDTYSTDQGPLFYQDITDTAPMVIINQTDAAPLLFSGGIVALPPVMVGYGNDGLIRWSEANDGLTWKPLSDTTKPFVVLANNKIIKAYRTWSGSTQALLLWSSTTLVRAVCNPGDAAADPAIPLTFDYITIQDNISIMSPNCITQYDQIFFWVGVDKFYYYNGVVNTLKNSLNRDWFFDNINTRASARVWALAIPRYNEVWFHYPRDPEPNAHTQTECNAVVMYNVEHQAWADSFISRAAGVPASVYPYPLMADSEGEPIGPDTLYPIWTHERGFDKVVFDNTYTIDSYFETHKQDMWTQNPNASFLIHIYRIAPDFRQNDEGVMNVTINVQQYPQGPVTSYGPFSFIGGTFNTDITPYIDVDIQGSIVSFFFRSNDLNGFYQEGKPLMYFKKGDTVK